MIRSISWVKWAAVPCFLGVVGGVMATAGQPLFSGSRLPRDNLLLYRDREGRVQPVANLQDWNKRRADIVHGMEAVMGRLPGAEKRCPLDVRIEEEIDGGRYIRRLLTYASEPGSRVPAYLLVPKDVLAGNRKARAVLCLHGTDNVVGHGVVVGLGNRSNRQYASELADRGYVVLAPNYPLLARYQPDLKKLGWESGTLKAVWDNIRGLDLLESLPFVEGGAFGAMGHSLGGHNAVFTGVFDKRLKVIVSSCGLDSFLDYYGGRADNWQPERGWCQTRYMPRLSDYRGRLADIPFDFHELVGALAPRHVLIIAPKKDTNFRADSVDRITASAREVYKLYTCPERLRVEHPDGGHDFPPNMREAGYQWIDAALGHVGPTLAGERIVNLGDSITDGQTYALLIEQALREAGRPLPKLFGAGIGGDTAAGMRRRLERDVLEHRPTLVMLSCGINDAHRSVKLADYEADVTAIAERLKSAHVKLMLLTTTNLQAAEGARVARLQEYNTALHRIAAKYGLRVAEVYDRMEEGRKRESTLWEPDGCHLNFTGYRWMTRAVLDALGQTDVTVPPELRLSVLPGLVREWKVLAVKENQPPLDENAVKALKPDGAWRTHTLPEKNKIARWWIDQERQRGVAVSLHETVGAAKSYIAVAEVPCSQARDVYLNTGAELRSVWLNGRRLLGPDDPYRGWHPGSYRLPVRLQAGNNRIVVETGSSFVVMLTDVRDW